MNFFQTVLKDIETIPGELANFFTAHQTAIHTVIADAQVGLSAATAIASVEAPGSAAAVATAVNKVSGLLNVAGSLVTSEATATTLTQTANNVATAVNSLSSTGVVGTKTQAAITNAVTKTNTVIGTLVTAAAAITPAP